MDSRLGRLLFRYKFTLLAIILFLLSVVAIVKFGKIETRIETFLPGYKPGRPIEEIDNPAVQNFIKMAKKFGDKGSLTLILELPATIDEKRSLEELRRVHEKVAKLPEVDTVISILNYPGAQQYITDEGIDFQSLPEQLYTFLSKDGKYALLVALLKLRGAEVEEDVVRRITNALKGEKLVTISEAHVNNKLFDELRRSMYFYPAAMFVVVFAIFYYQTRSFRATVLSLLIPLVASVYTYAIYFLTGKVLNILTSMIASFLLVIGSAYPLHYYNATFRSQTVRKHIGAPIFFSMLTTAIGFLSFVFVRIPAFREFGLYVSIGLLLIFLLTITVGDELLRLARKRAKGDPRSLGVRFFGKRVSLVILALSVVLVAISPLAISRIKIGLTNTDYFSRDSEVVRAYKLLEEKFNMKDNLYVVLEKKQGYFLPMDNRNIQEIIEKLSENPYVSGVDFPTNVPVTLLVLSLRNQPLLRHYIADGKTLRLSVKITNAGNEHVEELLNYIEKVLANQPYNFYVAGAPLIWKAVNDSILSSQIQSLVLTLVFVFLTVLFAFRSFKEALILIMPVSFATVLNFFYMSLFGMKLEISTAITSSIIIGLAIDYSIHIGYDYIKTKNPELTVQNVGPAILGNALGIVGGFLTMLVGGELALFKRVGLLVALGISTATLLTLMVMPYLLSLPRANEKAGKEVSEYSEGGDI
ncbi:efflux RND transporter permease subunit [Fervidobacterium thailandense]|uniref:efflux RND transporter permease subunit n=1 Tax=Fervidobacterium thailandense TaxID=1008305 RepID=UPI000AA69F5F|nr:MMPL family transporter [Fervidobacterium thailandense]